MKVFVFSIMIFVSTFSYASTSEEYVDVLRQFLVDEVESEGFYPKLNPEIIEVFPDSVFLEETFFSYMMSTFLNSHSYVLSFEGLTKDGSKVQVNCSLYSYEDDNNVYYAISNNEGLCNVTFIENAFMKLTPSHPKNKKMKVFDPITTLPYIPKTK